MTEQQKTHDLRPNPGMSANRLADYMASSEQARRSLLKGCKYRPRARLIQHQDAKESISEWVSSGAEGDDALQTRMEILRGGLQGSDFDKEVAEHNADYIERFLEVRPPTPAKAQEVISAGRMPALDLNGFSLSFSPDLVLRRVNRRNVTKMGVAFFRYSKNRALNPDAACWQGSISMGYLTTKLKQGLAESDAERDLCVTMDMWSGAKHFAPTNAVYRFNEVRAACAGIVERWDQIAPPAGAVF